MPLYTIFITPAADRDLIATIEYYNLQAEDLGYRFADLAEEYLNRISFTPFNSAIRYIAISDANQWLHFLTSLCSLLMKQKNLLLFFDFLIRTKILFGNIY